MRLGVYSEIEQTCLCQRTVITAEQEKNDHSYRRYFRLGGDNCDRNKKKRSISEKKSKKRKEILKELIDKLKKQTKHKHNGN